MNGAIRRGATQNSGFCIDIPGVVLFVSIELALESLELGRLYEEPKSELRLPSLPGSTDGSSGHLLPTYWFDPTDVFVLILILMAGERDRRWAR